MANVIVPVAQPLMVCEEIDLEGGLVNVYGLFNSLHARSFPYRREAFGVFAQLRGGLGEMSVRYDLVRARDERTIHVSHTRHLRFERRTQLVRVISHFAGVVFEEPGVYFLQLFCDNVLVADAVLEVLEETSDGTE